MWQHRCSNLLAEKFHTQIMRGCFLRGPTTFTMDNLHNVKVFYKGIVPSKMTNIFPHAIKIKLKQLSPVTGTQLMKFKTASAWQSSAIFSYCFLSMQTMLSHTRAQAGRALLGRFVRKFNSLECQCKLAPRESKLSCNQIAQGVITVTVLFINTRRTSILVEGQLGCLGKCQYECYCGSSHYKFYSTYK